MINDLIRVCPYHPISMTASFLPLFIRELGELMVNDAMRSGPIAQFSLWTFFDEFSCSVIALVVVEDELADPRFVVTNEVRQDQPFVSADAE